MHLKLVFIQSARQASDIPALAKKAYDLMEKLDQAAIGAPVAVYASLSHAAHITAQSLVAQFNPFGFDGEQQVVPQESLELGDHFVRHVLPRLRLDAKTILAVVDQSVIRASAEHLIGYHPRSRDAVLENMQEMSAFIITSDAPEWSKVDRFTCRGFDAA